MTIEQLRAAGRNQIAWQGPAPVMHAIVDFRIATAGHEIPVRVYRPTLGPRPVLVYFHGGGWVRGDVETYEQPCRLLAEECGCVVISVDYRLAPEKKFPAAVDDAFAAVTWAARMASEVGGMPGKLAVGGDSSGGTLAAAVARRARDAGRTPEIAYQLLIYPVTDYSFETPSYRDLGRDYAPSESAMRMFWSYYLRSPEDGDDPDASPLRAADLRGLPPACVITREFDPLRDDGELYARRLLEAGVPVSAVRLDGLVHGCLMMTGVVERARVIFDEAGSALNQAFAATGP
jgi:acetyl esterase